MPRKLPHYLRSERRRAALSQVDLSALLGVKTKSKVSRYERGLALPPLRTALAYEYILGRPLSKLFAGTYEEVCREVEARARKLLEENRDRRRSAGFKAMRTAAVEALRTR